MQTVLNLGWRGWLGLAVFLGGFGAAAIGGSYAVYALKARSDLDRLIVRPGPVSAEAALPREWLLAQSRDQALQEEPTNLLPPPEEAAPPALSVAAAEAPAESIRGSSPPGDAIQAGTAATTAGGLRAAVQTPGQEVERYRWVDWNALPRTLGAASAATRIRIPAIGVDSPVVDLGIVWDQDRRVWQRAKSSVGRHVGTANPGEAANVVMSGHINSPVRGEGSVFKRLPEVPALLEAGEPVDVYVSTEERTYVYRLVGSDVVKPEQVNAFAPTERPTLTLITCVPDLVFSHRLIVTGLLVKAADGGAASLGQVDEGAVVRPKG